MINRNEISKYYIICFDFQTEILNLKTKGVYNNTTVIYGFCITVFKIIIHLTIIYIFFKTFILTCFSDVIELDALEADMGLETESDGVPSYLQPDRESDLDSELNLPSAPTGQAAMSSNNQVDFLKTFFLSTHYFV